MNLTYIAGSVGDAIKNWFQGWFGALLSFIPKTFYQLLTPVYAVIDAIQWIMRKIAGLDTIYKFNGQTNVQGDIVMQFMNMIFTGSSPVLSNIFWSMIILGVLMLILTTMIAVVRSEYTATDAKSASKGKIIGNSLKALASFAIVPIVCFFGMFLCNVILQALDKVSTGSTSVTQSTINTTYFKSERTTSGDETYNNYTFFGFTVPTTTTPISGLVFKAAAYSANRARINDSFYNKMLNNDKISANGAFTQNKGTDSNSAYQNCWLMDEAFANCFQLKSRAYIDRAPFKTEHMFPVTLNAGVMIVENSLIAAGYTHFDKNNTALVWYYYDLWSFDYIIALGALVVVTVLLLYLVFGLIKRIFELTILFLVAAPIASLMPLDGGNALKKWREKFVAKTIGVYGPIVGLNLFFVILALLQSLELTGIAIIDKIVNLLFTIAGLAMVKDFTKMLSEIIGGEDTMGAGADKAKEIGATAAKVGKTAAAFTGVGGAVMKAGSMAAKAKGAKNAINNINAGKGKGRYAKGSQSYNNAVDNMADNVTDDQAISHLEGNSSVSQEEMFIRDEAKEYVANQYGITSDNYKQKGYKNFDEAKNELWNKADDLDKRSAESQAKNFLSGLDEEAKEFNINGISGQAQREYLENELKKEKATQTFNSMSDDDKNNLRKDTASAQLDKMDAKDRKNIIDKNFRSRGQNARIRNRAIAAAGGEEAYRNMSAEDREKLFNQERNPIGMMKTSKLAKGIQSTLGGGTVELGESTLKALSKSFVDFGKQIGSFAQHTMGAMSGPMMGEMKGLGGDMIQIAQGKLKKEMDLASEMKNQKKLRTAQNMAEESLGLGGANRRQAEPPEKPRPTELSDASVRKIASALQSNSDKISSVKLDDTSINKIGSAIAEKLNKKD